MKISVNVDFILSRYKNILRYIFYLRYEKLHFFVWIISLVNFLGLGL